MSALIPALWAGALYGSAPISPALAQVVYPYVANQSVYVAQPNAPAGQQYHVYAAQPASAAAAPRYASAAPPSYQMAAPAYTGTVAPQALPPLVAAPAPAPPPAAAALRSGGGFLEAIFGGPTIQAHVYAPFAPEYQTPAPQPTVINPTPAYASASPGDASAYPVDPKYNRQVVDYPTDEKPGTIVIDTPNKFLYLVEDGGKALRYGIGVGRPGFTWAGVKEISAKREWPEWRPPSDMLQRRPDLPRYMAGGVDNPLGARAMYLGSTLYRIHGSNEPWTIGTNVSSGCIRMRNDDVTDLYDRVKIGTKVVVI